MKTKKIRLNLSLNKKTIANLDSEKMNRINGGFEGSVSHIEGCDTCDSCNTCPSDDCQTNTCASNPAYITCPCPPTTNC